MPDGAPIANNYTRSVTRRDSGFYPESTGDQFFDLKEIAFDALSVTDFEDGTEEGIVCGFDATGCEEQPRL